MPLDPDKHSDPAAASASLAAEAALLEARLRMLQEAIDTVDARIEAIHDALRHLHTTAPTSAETANSQERCEPSGDRMGKTVR
ncbi:hypothetical protein [Streptomyces chiangmaiensis]|uniref:Uncharacterized protein n=1 Tax=Streptomyces chiangmaiensis TaxID=766497 RepID=A0ABU7FPT3_9ACTN|nr:hypothetical protein [Streptomyces chiangmaiensis]MED7826077.1 hypothetical protein [Streptomyces chiangmaiensis]